MRLTLKKKGKSRTERYSAKNLAWKTGARSLVSTLGMTVPSVTFSEQAYSPKDLVLVAGARFLAEYRSE
jgi:hypothetical protein